MPNLRAIPAACVDPERCLNCPPDQVCAWCCAQGWSLFEMEAELEANRALNAGSSLPALPESDGLWEAYNG